MTMPPAAERELNKLWDSIRELETAADIIARLGPPEVIELESRQTKRQLRFRRCTAHWSVVLLEQHDGSREVLFEPEWEGP